MALLLPHKPTLWDLFRFLLFSRFTRTVYLLSFSGFLLENVMRSASEAGQQEKDTNRLYHLIVTIMNIIGRLTRDAEVRTLSENKQVVNFSVAVNDSYKAKNGEK